MNDRITTIAAMLAATVVPRVHRAAALASPRTRPRDRCTECTGPPG